MLSDIMFEKFRFTSELKNFYEDLLSCMKRLREEIDSVEKGIEKVEAKHKK